MKYITQTGAIEKYRAPASHAPASREPINVIYQFFIIPNPIRQYEINFCLKQIQANPHVTTVYLLNERIYTPKEMGLENLNKIVQISLGQRLAYADVFTIVNAQQIRGWILIQNADIFYDESLAALQTLSPSERIVLCQLRWEFEPTKPIRLFGPRSDSQDTWIYHSQQNAQLFKHEKAFRFQLGMPGCDNHILYLFQVIGFTLLNSPQVVKCFHYHASAVRTYTPQQTIPPPYCQLAPLEMNYTNSQQVEWSDNTRLFQYLTQKLFKQQPFVIPRVAGVENNFAYTKSMILAHKMKNNAGVKVTSTASAHLYGNQYFKAFANCDVFTGWEKGPRTGWSYDVYQFISESQDYLEHDLCKNKPMLWASALEPYHYLYSQPWTTALKGKRILIVSAFIESIKEKIGLPIYPVELFPECTFIFSKPPQTQAQNPSMEWSNELAEYYTHLDTMKNDYDVALLSCGGYGNLISNYIYETHHKSAIYVGGVLSMYFGVYGKRWLQDRPSVIKMFLNQHWSRPKPSERPDGSAGVEGGCYW
jgi:hypothetical protein